MIGPEVKRIADQAAERLRGRLLFPDDADYETARVGRVFNAARPSRLPAAVLEAAGVEDVIEGVRLARRMGWRVSVRSGGHSWPAWSVRDGALLIELGKLRNIHYDVTTGLVTVQPAVTAAELLPALAEHGRMFQTGHAPDVGLGGYLLQGGAGWNTRGWGWACERIVGLDVVTADGQLIHADRNNNEDLFWAARGAGHGFCGVVTRFELETRPMPAAILESFYLFRPELVDRVLEWALQAQDGIGLNVEFGVIGTHFPEHGPMISMYALAFAETEQQAAEALAPFEHNDLADQAVVRVDAQPTTLQVQLARILEHNPATLRYLSDSAWTSGSTQETVSCLRKAFVELPTEHSEALWMSLDRHDPLPDMALSLQTNSYVALFPKWEDEADDETCHDWLAERMAEIDPVSAGVFLGDCDLARRDAPFMAEANRSKLEEIRAYRDPDGLFCSFMTAEDLTQSRAVTP